MTAARRRALLATTTVLLVLPVVGACAARQELPADPPIADPGYPSSQTPSAEPTSTPLPTAPVSPPPSSTDPTDPPAEPSASPSPEPTPDDEPTTPEPEPTRTPEAVAFVPECGAELEAPRTLGELRIDLASDVPTTIGPEDWFATTATATNLTDATIPDVRLFTSVTIAQDGVVVGRWLGGSEAPVAADLASGEQVELSVEHSFAQTCEGATAGPAPTDSTPAEALGTEDPTQEHTPSDSPTAETPAPDRLPAGEYTVLVALHVVVDGGDPLDPLAPPSVLATAGPVDVVVTD
ncbi:hypothetical protein Bcav_0631 [Beutenbergia cavernae DSM 12333]|uniref:Uncharacterized protein n=2 Tax=Beutenbergia TaxID=84756 RepID=C5BXZ9_BEUC1|nr:hypothetical protein Bcav_0631 [Beutenbergia cavernae DSM 12333]